MPSQEHEAAVERVVARMGSAGESIEEQRSAYADLLGSFAVPDDVVVESLQAGKVSVDRVSLDGTRPARTILYLHGGAYVLGSSGAYREFGARLARATNATVYIVDYRLAPEHPFPAALEDALAAYEWLLASGFGVGSLFVAGDSAGGGLTLSLLLALRAKDLVLPAGAILFSPWVDLEGTGASSEPGAVDDPLATRETIQQMGQLYAPRNATDPLASPVHADLVGLPPLLALVSTRDVLLDDARRIASSAESAGVRVRLREVDGLIHVWPVFAPEAPESHEALRNAKDFMHTISNGSG